MYNEGYRVVSYRSENNTPLDFKVDILLILGKHNRQNPIASIHA